jgi:hypothetical protein
LLKRAQASRHGQVTSLAGSARASAHGPHETGLPVLDWGPRCLCGGRPGRARLSPHVAPDRHTTALERVLEVVRGEGGNVYLLLEYLGYQYLEIPAAS